MGKTRAKIEEPVKPLARISPVLEEGKLRVVTQITLLNFFLPLFRQGICNSFANLKNTKFFL